MLILTKIGKSGVQELSVWPTILNCCTLLDHEFPVLCTDIARCGRSEGCFHFEDRHSANVRGGLWFGGMDARAFEAFVQ